MRTELKPFTELTTLDEVAQNTISIINRNLARGRVVGFAWNIWAQPVRNTHDCPLNGERNWGGQNPNLPTSYPGWMGRVWIRYENRKEVWGHDPFRNTLTYTGTGGCGAYDGLWSRISNVHHRKYGHGQSALHPKPDIYSWDYHFYGDDFPTVKSFFDADCAFQMIRNAENSPNTQHDFRWEDPAVLAADRTFLESMTYNT